MNLNKDNLIIHIKNIRREIGHDEADIHIKDIIFNKHNNELWIITPDRPDKSAIIGKGGWVVGRLREETKINKIHVESYSDFILKKYKMELSLNSLNSLINEYRIKQKDYTFPLNNLKILLKEKINNIYNFDFNEYFKNSEETKNNEIIKNSEETKNNEIVDPLKNNEIVDPLKNKAIVALSGGVDSSFSLILAKKLGFNPLAITIDPGTIILPKQFKNNIENLCKELEVEHKYININYEEIVKDALEGKFHPCGRCSKLIEDTLFNYASNNDVDVVIFGDMLSTGSQCITKYNTKDKNGISKEIVRLNLPATLSVGKEEIKNTVQEYNIERIKGFGCPLLYEVHKNYPHMKKFSIQRILRETRAGVLEPGEALDLIWSFYKLN